MIIFHTQHMKIKPESELGWTLGSINTRAWPVHHHHQPPNFERTPIPCLCHCRGRGESETRPASAEARDGSGKPKEKGRGARARHRSIPFPGSSFPCRVRRAARPRDAGRVLPPYPARSAGKKNACRPVLRPDLSLNRCSNRPAYPSARDHGGDVPADGCDHKLHGGANDGVAATRTRTPSTVVRRSS